MDLSNLKRLFLTLFMIFWNPRKLLEEREKFISGLRLTLTVLGGVMLFGVLRSLVNTDVSIDYNPRYSQLFNASINSNEQFMETFFPVLTLINFIFCYSLPLFIVFRKIRPKDRLSLTFYFMTIWYVSQVFGFFTGLTGQFTTMFILPLLVCIYFITRTLRGKNRLAGLVIITLFWIPSSYLFYSLFNNFHFRLYQIVAYSQKSEHAYPKTEKIVIDKVFQQENGFTGNIQKPFYSGNRTFVRAYNYVTRKRYVAEITEEGDILYDLPLNSVRAIASEQDKTVIVDQYGKSDLELITMNADRVIDERDSLKLAFFHSINGDFNTTTSNVIGLTGSMEINGQLFPASGKLNVSTGLLFDTVLWNDLALENQRIIQLHAYERKYLMVNRSNSSLKLSIADSLGAPYFVRTIFEESDFQDIGRVKSVELGNGKYALAFIYPDEKNNKLRVVKVDINKAIIEWEKTFEIPNDYILNQTLDMVKHKERLYVMMPTVFIFNSNIFDVGEFPSLAVISLEGELESVNVLSVHDGTFLALRENLWAECFIELNKELYMVLRHQENMEIPLIAKDQTFFHKISD